MIYANSTYWNSERQWKPRVLYPMKNNGFVNARTLPGLTSNGWVVKFSYPQPVGTSTGRTAKETATDSLYWIEVKAKDGKLLWVRNDVVTESLTTATKAVTPAKPTTKAKSATAAKPSAPKPSAPKPRLSTQQGKGGDGKLCVENIVANDKQTHLLLVQANYYKTKAAQSGVSGIGVVDTKMEAELARLTKSYNTRQQKLRTSTLLRVQTGISETVQSWVDAVKNMISGVGVLPLAVVIPVAVVALAGTGYLVWRAFFQDESTSAKDVLAAAKLRDTYQRMSEEEKELFDETVKSAGNAGLKEGQANWKNMALFAGGGFLLFNALKGNRK